MFKRSLVYLLLNYIIQFLNIALNLIFMRYLTSSQMGHLTLARTWQQLLDYTHLGTRFSLDRYIPVTEDSERLYLVASVFIFTFISAFFFLIIAVVSNVNDVTVAILTSCGLCISLVNIIKSFYRAINNINYMLMLVFNAQLLPVLIPLLTYLYFHNWNIYLASSIICYLSSLAYLIYKERQIFSGFNLIIFLSNIKNIATSSALLFLNSVFVFLYLVMDRFFIKNMLGIDALGHYSVITFAFTALMIIPSTCAELLFVKIIKESCKQGKKHFVKELLIIISVTLVGIISANFLMGYFINNFTKYGALIDDMHLATLGVIPFALTAIYYHVMNGLDLRKQLVVVNGLTCMGLLIYYLIPVFTSYQVDLNYYLYGKLLTGWFILMGYIFFINNDKSKKHRIFRDLNS
ncbi:oligosaccharide flippase family protein [Lelliottia amnigena]|uniref:Putative O-antigen transporter n=1 Tax=Lelliottia amnigena TaxID=61646 RepID=A0AAP2AHW5_LELAM|nr:oligosaccharide flippase family protein [Lelliottia amnigena]MBL5936564.1 oligosaccharide flippase family protein [Lelliottia amnigena]